MSQAAESMLLVTRGRRKKLSRLNFPQNVTDTLREWFEANLESPFPSVEQKFAFAEQLGISFDQVSHWFVNARMRIWPHRHTAARSSKTMVEQGVSITQNPLSPPLSPSPQSVVLSEVDEESSSLSKLVGCIVAMSNVLGRRQDITELLSVIALKA